MDPLDQIGDPTKGQYGILKIQTSPLGTDSASASTDPNGNILFNIKILFNVIFIIFFSFYVFKETIFSLFFNVITNYNIYLYFYIYRWNNLYLYINYFIEFCD